MRQGFTLGCGDDGNLLIDPRLTGVSRVDRMPAVLRSPLDVVACNGPVPCVDSSVVADLTSTRSRDVLGPQPDACVAADLSACISSAGSVVDHVVGASVGAICSDDVSVHD